MTVESGRIGKRWGTDAACDKSLNCILGRSHEGPCRGTYGDIILEPDVEYVGKHRRPE